MRIRNYDSRINIPEIENAAEDIVRELPNLSSIQRDWFIEHISIEVFETKEWHNSEFQREPWLTTLRIPEELPSGETALTWLRGMLAHEMWHAYEAFRNIEYRAPIRAGWNVFLTSQNEFTAAVFECRFWRYASCVIDALEVYADKTGQLEKFRSMLSTALDTLGWR